ncbi:MAG: class I SAM-dependent methyltransferase [Acidimicrobiia bacterium]|nr:class I SAM-dependent methyltransferase [Acidimicrobiia bacterium]
MTNTSTSREHWSQLWSTRSARSVKWFQVRPTVSIDLISSVENRRTAAVIDIGGGASTLVDHLLDLEYTDLTVLDITDVALDRARARLGERADSVHWITADVRTDRLDRLYDLWHDRAVFHFLTDAADRARYVEAAERSIAPGGHLVIATFATDGPDQCSGLPVQRYSPESLAAELAPAFTPIAETDEQHRTPGGDLQHFVYMVLQRPS